MNATLSDPRASFLADDPGRRAPSEDASTRAGGPVMAETPGEDELGPWRRTPDGGLDLGG